MPPGALGGRRHSGAACRARGGASPGPDDRSTGVLPAAIGQAPPSVAGQAGPADRPVVQLGVDSPPGSGADLTARQTGATLRHEPTDSDPGVPRRSLCGRLAARLQQRLERMRTKPNQTLVNVFAREEARRAAEGCQQLRKGMRYWRGKDSGIYLALAAHYQSLRAAWAEHRRGSCS